MESQSMVVFGIFALIALLSILGGVWSRRRELARARELAARLGLEFVQGFDSSRMDLPEASALAGFLMAISPWRVVGEFEGRRVCFYKFSRSSGKSRSSWTAFELMWKKSPPCSFTLGREGIFTKLGKALSLSADIDIGDAGFDGSVLVRGGDPDAVRAFLAPAAAREAVLCALERFPDLEISDARARLEFRGVVLDEERVRGILEAMARLGDGLGL